MAGDEHDVAATAMAQGYVASQAVLGLFLRLGAKGLISQEDVVVIYDTLIAGASEGAEQTDDPAMREAYEAARLLAEGQKLSLVDGLASLAQR